MNEHYHKCFICDVDLLPAPCACRWGGLKAYRCEDRDACDERAGAEVGPYQGEME